MTCWERTSQPAEEEGDTHHFYFRTPWHYFCADITDEALRDMIYRNLASNVKVRDSSRDRFRDLAKSDLLISSPKSFKKKLQKFGTMYHSESLKAKKAWESYKDFRLNQLENYLLPIVYEREAQKLLSFIGSKYNYFDTNINGLYGWYLQHFVFSMGRQKLCYVACHLGLVKTHTPTWAGWREEWEDEYSNAKATVEYQKFLMFDRKQKRIKAIARLNMGRRPDEAILEKEDEAR